MQFYGVNKLISLLVNSNNENIVIIITDIFISDTIE
jgi:hypothetical protein